MGGDGGKIFVTRKGGEKEVSPVCQSGGGVASFFLELDEQVAGKNVYMCPRGRGEKFGNLAETSAGERRRIKPNGSHHHGGGRRKGEGLKGKGLLVVGEGYWGGEGSVR